MNEHHSIIVYFIVDLSFLTYIDISHDGVKGSSKCKKNVLLKVIIKFALKWYIINTFLWIDICY